MRNPRRASSLRSAVGFRLSINPARLAVALLCFATTLEAQIVTRRPREEREAEASGPPSTWVGGTLAYASPTGDFKKYVDGAFGVDGHLVHQFGGGIVAFRADLGYMIYGSATRRQSLGGGALGLIAVDVTTSNNIVNGGVGLQLQAPTGSVRPYVNGNLGFSYFFTQSSVEGTSNTQEPFADTKNFDDSGFSPSFGGGIYIPVWSRGENPVLLDIGVQSHTNSDMRYLTKESIYIANSSSTPVITPVRSSANFVSFRIGVSVGLSRRR